MDSVAVAVAALVPNSHRGTPSKSPSLGSRSKGRKKQQEGEKKRKQNPWAEYLNCVVAELSVN